MSKTPIKTFKVTKKQFLWLSLFVTSLFWISGLLGVFFHFLDPGYVGSLNLPPDGDSIMIPIIGSLLNIPFVLTLNFAVHMIVYAILLRKKIPTVDLYDFLWHPNMFIINFFKFLTMMFLLRELYLWIVGYYFINFPILILDGVNLFAFIGSVLFGLIWITSLGLRSSNST